MSRDLTRRLGFWGLGALMVGSMIGSGIFRTPTSIANQLGSPTMILVFWIVGGLLALCGCLTFAELSTMFPRSGGMYVYLHRSYGPVVAFVFGWCQLLIARPLGAAGIAMVFADHVNQLLATAWDPRIATVVVILALTFINVVGVRAAASLAVVLTAIKVAALFAIVVLGVVLVKGSAANLAAIEAPKPFLLALVPTMVAVLWTYDGWSGLANVAGEAKEPQRLLPKTFLLGMVGTIAIYLAINVVYLSLIPLAEMREIKTVAPVVVERLVGAGSGKIVTCLVLVSTLGATHGVLLTGARVGFAQARDGLVFRSLAGIHSRYDTPHVSLWVQAILACFATIVLGQFERITAGFVFSQWIFYGLTATALVILRVRRPEIERPYRCWGYPVVPVLFIASALGMTALSIMSSLRDTVPWMVILLLGVPTYYVWRRVTSAPEAVE